MGYDTEEICILCFSVWFLVAFFYTASTI